MDYILELFNITKQNLPHSKEISEIYSGQYFVYTDVHKNGKVVVLYLETGQATIEGVTFYMANPHREKRDNLVQFFEYNGRLLPHREFLYFLQNKKILHMNY